MMTAGSTLQNGKYLIEATLYQSDFSVTYQAAHRFLAQSVVIQTLNDSLRQHPRFAQLKQQFLAEVRRHARDESTSIARIQDYFEEDDKPFVVLERVPGQTPAQLSAWLNFLNRDGLESVIVPSSSNSAQPMSAVTSAGTIALQPIAPQPIAPQPIAPQPIALQSVAPQPAISAPETSVTPTRPVNNDSIAPNPSVPTETPAPAANGSAATQPVSLAVSSGRSVPLLPHPQPYRNLPSFHQPVPEAALPVERRSARRLLPLALAMTAIASGLTGAGLGWSLRFQQPGESNSPTLFSREQSFPPKEDWLGEDPYEDSNRDSDEDNSEQPYDDETNFAPTGNVIEQRQIPEFRPEPQELAPYRPRNRRAPTPEAMTVPEFEVLPEEKVIPAEMVDIAPVPPAEAAPAVPEPAIEAPPVIPESGLKTDPLPAVAPSAPEAPPAPVVAEPAPIPDATPIAQ